MSSTFNFAKSVRYETDTEIQLYSSMDKWENGEHPKSLDKLHDWKSLEVMLHFHVYVCYISHHVSIPL